jgi:hypothetical protein
MARAMAERPRTAAHGLALRMAHYSQPVSRAVAGGRQQHRSLLRKRDDCTIRTGSYGERLDSRENGYTRGQGGRRACASVAFAASTRIYLWDSAGAH